MNREKLIEHISKGTSLSESEELYDWINQSVENEKEYIRYKNLHAILNRGKEIVPHAIKGDFDKIKKRINQTGKKVFLKSLGRIAAVGIIAVLCTYVFYQVDFNKEVASTEIIVPKGNRMSVKLPDGTIVWLSNGTKLIYPESFQGKSREVNLEGEGYFEVEHDKNHPFVVNTGKHRIKVLGTKFAVVAYPNDNTISAELLSGRIQFDVNRGENNVCSYELKPRHSLVLEKSTGKLYESEIPEGYFDYWQYGRYVFKDEAFSSLAKKINRIYNVEIVFQSEDLKDLLFTGTFNIDDNIYTLMEVFKKASGKPFEYEQKKGKIYVRGKLKNE